MTDQATQRGIFLPRTIGLIHLEELGCIEVGTRENESVYLIFLTRNGGAIIQECYAGAEPVDITPIDIVEALNDFCAHADNEGINPSILRVGLETIAQLFAQRIVRAQDVTDDRVRPVDPEQVARANPQEVNTADTWAIALPATAGGFDHSLTLWFSPHWAGVYVVGAR